MATTTISLSITRILESVYAHSAAESLSSGIERPEILGRAREAMLKVICRDVIAGITMKFGKALTGSNLGSAQDIVTLDLRLPDSVIPTLFQPALETAVAARVLARARSGSKGPMCERYERVSEMSAAVLARHLASGPLPDAIRPTA